METEYIVKELIAESLNKRIKGHGDIDSILNNYVLIKSWVTHIMALGFNNFNVEEAVRDIYDIEKPMMGVFIEEKSIESYRAEVSLSNQRFPDEVYAFQIYSELRDKAPAEEIIERVKNELSVVEEGEFLFC